MKAEMKIKENAWKEMDAEKTAGIRRRWKNDRSSRILRGGMCAALLFLLAAGGYAGSIPEDVSLTAAPVVFSAEEEQLIQGMSFDEIEKRQESGRRTEIEMLDGIIENENTDETTRSDALAQKLQLVNRMDTELNVAALLSHMGYEKAAVLCGAGQISVIIPEESLRNEDDTLRMIDAAASCAEIDAKDVKIILVKK